MINKVKSTVIGKKQRIIILLFVSSVLVFISIYILLTVNERYLYSNKVDQIAIVNNIVIEKQITPYKIGRPIRLIIPSIKVDAKIEETGLNNDYAMIPPKLPESIAWFKLGPKPGEVGSSVLAGHFGWKNGIHAVFDNLSKIKISDKIYVFDDLGNENVFQVKFLRRFGSEDRVEDVFISNDGVAHLNLVTCEGVWNKLLKSYSKRLVVFSEKI